MISLGLWLPFFAFIIQTSLANPDGVSMLLCLPIQIKTKYYPIALWVLLSLFSRGPRLDLLIALLVGYIHYKYLNSAYHSYLDASRMSAWSSTMFFSFFKNLPSTFLPDQLSLICLFRLRECKWSYYGK